MRLLYLLEEPAFAGALPQTRSTTSGQPNTNNFGLDGNEGSSALRPEKHWRDRVRGARVRCRPAGPDGAPVGISASTVARSPKSYPPRSIMRARASTLCARRVPSALWSFRPIPRPPVPVQKFARLSAGGRGIRTLGSGASGEADAILPVKDRPR